MWLVLQVPGLILSVAYQVAYMHITKSHTSLKIACSDCGHFLQTPVMPEGITFK